eukprot:GHVN01011871.1.p1 GENE.GHVN01011871.1~~GHVN01011871.1.p1  ORF type:complete len:190 (+),score=22.42 GHVN01011871.1:234-803(+)
MDVAALSASENVAGDGFFSVGVLQRCLGQKGFAAHQWNKEEPNQLLGEKGFICHQSDHWFAIRKIGSQWWNLDSMKAPRRITEQTLASLLWSLRQGGYSVFIIRGGNWERRGTAGSLEPHQHWLTEAEADKIPENPTLAGGDGEGGGTSFGMTVNPRAKEPDVQLYQGKGNVLSSGTTPADALAGNSCK